jgi:MFS family permease
MTEVPHTTGGRRWLPVVVAAFAMVATLPGRTHGLGLITEPLLADLHLDRVTFATVNLWATLIGAAFCLPCGWLIDRLGGRVVQLAVTLGLAASVLGMGQVRSEWSALAPGLFVLVLLTRGFGQSALSVVSLAQMGRAVGETRKAGAGVGVYSFVTAIGFMGAFIAIKHILEKWEPSWRHLWDGIGAAVALFGVVAFLLVRDGATSERQHASESGDGMTLVESLRTPAFWVFALATSLYGMIAAGLSLFNQSILAERGFDRSVFLTITAVTPLVGLGANLGTGWLSGRFSQGRLLAVAMALLAAAMVAFPFVRTLTQVYAYAFVLGVTGGMVTVIFFGVWGQAFGTGHLGKIQGAAQMLTVLASALGPLTVAWGQHVSGSYVSVFRGFALASAVLGLAAWWVQVPRAVTLRALEEAA